MANESAPRKDPYRWRRRGALVGIVAAMGALPETAQAQSQRSSGGSEAVAAATDKTQPPKKEAQQQELKDFKESQKVIESLLNSKKPNLYYGAIVIEKPYTPKIPTIAYVTPAKNPVDRIATTTTTRPLLIRDPLIAEVDGVTYLLTYYRGSNDESNAAGKDAGTDMKDIAQYRYIDIAQAMENGKVEYYSHGGEMPSMQHTYSYDGNLEAQSKRLSNPIEDLRYDFTNSVNPLAAFLETNNLQPLPGSYKPPFLK